MQHAALNLQSFKERVITPLFLGLFLVGLAVSIIGVYSEIPLLMIIGSALRASGLAWLFVMMGIALMQLGPGAAALAIAWAFVLKYCWMILASPLAVEVKMVLYFVLPFIVVLLARRYTVSFFSGLDSSESQANLEVTSPASFLPFTHALLSQLLCLMQLRDSLSHLAPLLACRKNLFYRCCLLL